MRIEREWDIQDFTDTNSGRRDIIIHETETVFCEDPACEATHVDPAIGWDRRDSFILAECYSRARADRVVAALRAHEAGRMDWFPRSPKVPRAR